MADYSSFIFNALNGVGDSVLDNRKRREMLAQQKLENEFAQRKYSDALMQDQRDFDYKKQRDQVGDQQWQQSYNLNRDKAYTTDDMLEYRMAKKEGFGGNFNDWMNAKRRLAGGGYGLNIYYGKDASGNIVPMQAGPNGELIASRVPEGVTPMGPFDKASDTAAGKSQGTNAANLPNALAAGDRIVRGIDDALADPGLSRVTGPIQSWLPNVSGDANRAQSRLDQIQGGTFLQAYNDLRGGGQITEKEGEKATAAYNRLSSTGMNDADYRNALAEFKSEVLKLMDIARKRAGQGGASDRPGLQPGTYNWTPNGLQPAQ